MIGIFKRLRLVNIEKGVVEKIKEMFITFLSAKNVFKHVCQILSTILKKEIEF